MENRLTARQKVLLDKQIDIENGRRHLSAVLLGEHAVKKMVAIVGPCSLQLGTEHIREGVRLMRENSRMHHIAMVQRAPTTKPRTNADAWKGLDHSDPEEAMRLTAWAVRRGIKRAIELRDAAHVEQYQDLLSLGWSGARNLSLERSQRDQMDDALIRAHSLPFGIKNDLSGDVTTALERVEKITKGRAEITESPAPVVLIFRGGDTIHGAERWTAAYRDVLKETKGRVIIDTAHGNAAAHDSRMRKTNEGQEQVLHRIWQVARDELLLPAGVMIEASDMRIQDPLRETDPNLPLDTALSYLRDIHSVIQKQADTL